MDAVFVLIKDIKWIEINWVFSSSFGVDMELNTNSGKLNRKLTKLNTNSAKLNGKPQKLNAIVQS